MTNKGEVGGHNVYITPICKLIERAPYKAVASIQSIRLTAPPCGTTTATLPDTSPDGDLPVAKRLNGLSY